ncbi:MAG TPA: phosphotransferase family protein [Acidimicrobiales bacterium]|nr:phosphotransferase family protein [Acidimicrobiales bacterium]
MSQDEDHFAGDLKRSSRDIERVRAGLRAALEARVPEGRRHSVDSIAGTSSTGMSSETLLFDASWDEGGGRHVEHLVARVAPQQEDIPVFPSYDLPGQFLTIQTVASLTDVPVPNPWWCEADPAVIGSPFFVMGRADGEVPTDIPPYNFGDGWLYHASPEQQMRLQESTVAVLAELHAIPDPEKHFSHLAGGPPGATALRRHFEGRRRWYEWAARDSGRSALLEATLSWLEERWPAHESPTVFCWGDARIGNVMYRDFEPSAVLDWEMAGLAPGETDLAWLAYLHQMFEEMAETYGFAHMPHLLRIEDVATAYERLTRRAPRDLEWYLVYSALQLGIVYLRTGMRSVRFGERAAPDDPDELIINADGLRRLIGA